MADYFTYFSIVVSLSKAAQAYAVELAAKAQQYRFDEDSIPTDFPPELVESLEGWWFETEALAEGLWLHSDQGGIDQVCVFIQHLLAKFKPTEHVAFEWSHDCSKPRTDAYGGGAALITAHEIKSMTTSVWLASVVAQLTPPSPKIDQI